MMFELSVLIAARNEMFLQRTIEDVLENSDDRTEIIVVLDGYWSDPGLPIHPRVTLIHREISIGQRGAVNEAARVSRAKYLMKLDAHCAMDKGFDAKLIEAAAELGDKVTQVPLQRNLHVFDWQCDGCSKRTYQGPELTKCECGGEEFHREMVWKPKRGTRTTSWVFDSELHFQYGVKPSTKDDFIETMSLLGACYFMSRERFWELDGLDDEAYGSWGQMGTEIACKSWLSGGRVVTNRRTHYSHLFRTRGGFSFPYKISGKQVSRAKKYSRELWRNNLWPKQVRPLSWLVDKFWPIKVKTGDGKVIDGWSDAARTEVAMAETFTFEEVCKRTRAEIEAAGVVIPIRAEVVMVSPSPFPSIAHPTKGVVWYTDNRLDPTIAGACQRQLTKAVNGHEIVTVGLKPLDFGDIRVVMARLERGYLAMFRQILAGLKVSNADVVFFCEHDVAYHPSHFDFTPPSDQIVYYNENVWKVNAETGDALFYYTKQTSGLCAYRELLIEHYQRRVALVEEKGFSRKIGFEPGSHNRAERVDDLKSESWMSEHPNIDIRHGGNLTPSRWRQDQFRNQRSCRGWKESDSVPGWSKTKGRFDDFLKEVNLK